ncbi:ubiquitin-conjugating enzyme E2 R2-like [Drosophila willistoni]|uniref:ubiquitin-conjugating enzyme E2 R2-like n=1 Tax=Drosophila willistoni TaxID=7260 RepID=UPI001F075C0B|nr:ubiquitin-conjugating enzyme E2 R2-like [Drosophila willistoni]
MFGPPLSLYEGAYLEAILRFPNEYPYAPPTFQFSDQVYHPNVDINGFVCISILHPPSDGVSLSGELPSERWSPVQNARSILLSIVSLLDDPNELCPANTEAADTYRRWRDPKIMDMTYPNKVRQLAIESNAKALRMGIIVPTKLEDYCLKAPIEPELNDVLNDTLFNDYDEDDSSNEDEYSDDDYAEDGDGYNDSNGDGDGEEGDDDNDGDGDGDGEEGDAEEEDNEEDDEDDDTSIDIDDHESDTNDS